MEQFLRTHASRINPLALFCPLKVAKNQMKSCFCFLLIGLRAIAQDSGSLGEALDLPGYNWQIEGTNFVVMNDDPVPDTDYVMFGSIRAEGVWLKVSVQGPGVLSINACRRTGANVNKIQRKPAVSVPADKDIVRSMPAASSQKMGASS